ncbi:raffinose/stachyose/melibiose transport system permease protein [Butyrivibrio proteoclasticus]|uniref:Raffinose/stachyose/melibiose transport system permease protein n=1 Tax=Butyrivibrio proteoclasticus TaxID=43305 RepID=A0A1I5QF13_9FIRM|nr:sugar ABC transporter permease [Butyrivibrio proteoclasticus]SFP44842.1 raffinose/stachyose/melibiose transport system permease protein [Butyrivibrio proteoclasticus]
MKKYMGNKLAIFLFVLPALAIFIIFDFFPIIQVFAYSFTDWNGLTTPTFLGLKNYIDLFNDRVFYTSNRNQLIFAIIITVYQMFFATVFAITISDKKMKGRKFLRVAYFIPVILSVTVVCQLWSAILSGQGLLNKLFETFGSDYTQNWLGDRYKAIYVIAFVNAWQWMGYQFALIVAGIKSIPADYYEAAKIDGCSNVKAHMKITIPLLAETYKFCLIISLTGGIKAFTEMNILTGGGPNKSTFTLTYMMYNAAFKKSDYGYGLASASIMVIECMLVMLLINFIFREKNQLKEEEKSKKRRLSYGN